MFLDSRNDLDLVQNFWNFLNFLSQSSSEIWWFFSFSLARKSVRRTYLRFLFFLKISIFAGRVNCPKKRRSIVRFHFLAGVISFCKIMTRRVIILAKACAFLLFCFQFRYTFSRLLLFCVGESDSSVLFFVIFDLFRVRWLICYYGQQWNCWHEILLKLVHPPSFEPSTLLSEAIIISTSTLHWPFDLLSFWY